MPLCKELADKLRKINRISRGRACERCGAKVGEACKTANGTPTREPHEGRRRYARARYNREKG